MKKRISILVLSLILAFAFPLLGCGEKPHADLPVDIVSIYGLDSLKNVPSEHSDATPLFWEVTGKDGGTAYLFGSYHAADASYLRLSDEIIQAYIDSDALAVEVDIVKASAGIAAAQMAQAMIYLDGTTLYDHIPYGIAKASIDLITAYPQYLGGMGFNADTLKMLKPGAISALIQNIAMQQAGFTADFGADTLFLNISKEIDKEIIEIEKLSDQIDLLYGVSDTMGKLMLQDTVDYTPAEYVSAMVDELEESYDAWKRGDLEYFEQSVLPVDLSQYGLTEDEIAEYNVYNYRMMDERNVIMTNAVKSYLSGNRTVFVIVGEAHMVGETGIVNALRQAGHTVTMKSGTPMPKAMAA
jgi:uncharacterized protein YbaP (TraB family)